MNSKSESLIEIYQLPDSRGQVALRLHDETTWLTQAQMAELFEVAPQNFTMHLKNVYASAEACTLFGIRNKKSADNWRECPPPKAPWFLSAIAGQSILLVAVVPDHTAPAAEQKESKQ